MSSSVGVETMKFSITLCFIVEADKNRKEALQDKLPV